MNPKSEIDDLKELKDQYRRLYESEAELQTLFNRRGVKLAALQREVAEKDQQLALHQEMIKDLLENRSSIESQKAGKKQNIKDDKLSKKQLLEEKRKWEEEKAAKDQQLRAYKRQVDDLRQQLAVEREKHQQLKRDQEVKLHELTTEVEKEKKTVSFYMELSHRCENELSITNNKLERSKLDTDQMKMANVELRRKLTQELLHPEAARGGVRGVVQVESRSEQVIPDIKLHVPPHHPHSANELMRERNNNGLEEYTKRADMALKDLDEAKMQTRITHGNTYSDQNIHGANTFNSMDRSQTYPFARVELEDDDDDTPYDPNLVCPSCKARYRVGEIQKLRRHINEFCTGHAS